MVKFVNTEMDQLGGILGNKLYVLEFLVSDQQYRLMDLQTIRYFSFTMRNVIIHLSSNSVHISSNFLNTMLLGLVKGSIKGSVSEEISLPLYCILLSVGNPVVDYFSVDVEGAEMGILKSIPWHMVQIKVKV